MEVAKTTRHSNEQMAKIFSGGVSIPQPQLTLSSRNEDGLGSALLTENFSFTKK